MVSPAQFIPLAEHCGLINEIGGWVIEEVCRQIAVWNSAGLPGLCVAINVSAQQMRGDNCVSLLEEAMRANGIDGRQIELEITESMMMEDIGDAVTYLARFKELGVGIAIDDFGTGFSSLMHLKRLPLNALKIDLSFVRQMLASPADRAIVESTIHLAHDLGLAVVAEGIEDEATLEALRAQGCDEGQGFAIGRPRAGEATAAWLAARPA